MAIDFDGFAILLLLSPFLFAALAPLISQETGKAAGWILAIVPTGLFVALVTLVDSVAAGQSVPFSIDWVPALGLSLSFVVDGLSLVFALLITGIGAVILIYAGAYMESEAHRGRFLAALLLFLGAMLGLVLADSLVALFAFWELTSVTSFLLIGYEHKHPEARRAALQALVVTGIGGLALIVGGVLLAGFGESWNLSELGEPSEAWKAGAGYALVLPFFLLAAFTKSAQVPFHFWLPNAMEAPTPVSAFLHSATMVQAGVYLLARLSPILGGTPLWQGLLCGFGGATLLWGAVVALKQTDLKQMLAQTTIASLGLSVLLLGLGGAQAAMAVAAYFIAHALYKAGLFLTAGILDKQTGTRDITVLGGLRDTLTITFIATALAGISMFGLPPFLGYLAKEEIYAGLGYSDAWAVVALVVLVLGNALLGATALAVVIRPFMGALKPTPKTPTEGSFALWIGPALFGLLGLAVVFALLTYGEQILAPMASVISGATVESHLTLAFDPRGLPIWLSVATWAIAVLIYWHLDLVRSMLLALGQRFTWSWDRGFDQVMFGLVRLSGGAIRTLQHGALHLYLAVLFAMVALSLLWPMLAFGALPSWPRIASMTPYEWAAIVIAAIGAVAVVASPTRLSAIIALGIQGMALSLIFLFFGAPDLGFTQLLVETLSVVILALVMTRLHLGHHDRRPLADRARDGVIAVLAGVAVTLVLLRVLEIAFDPRLSTFFAENSVALAHGRNIVNVILVDFRALDTLGEIAVVMTAGVAVLALLRRQPKLDAEVAKPKRASRRKAAA